MAKDNAQKHDAPPFAAAAAPIFALTRAALDELDRQAERWMAYGNAQSAEMIKATRSVLAQAVAASRQLCDSFEEATARALEGAAAWAPNAQPGQVRA